MVTCAQEQDLVLAVGCSDLIDSDGGVFVVSMCPHEQRPPAHGVDGIEHDRVVPDERHHIVRELFGALDVGRKSSPRTLEQRNKGTGGEGGGDWTQKFQRVKVNMHVVQLFVDITNVPLLVILITETWPNLKHCKQPVSSVLSALEISALGAMESVLEADGTWRDETHCARSGVGNASLESHPLEVGALPVGEGPVEDGQDVGHIVHAHG